MVVGAHSDDVEFLAGGIFARLAGEGARGLYVVAVSGPWINPPLLYKTKTTAEAINIRRKEAGNAANMLGAARMEFLNAHTSNLYKKRIDVKNRLNYPKFKSHQQTINELQDVVFDGNIPFNYAVHHKEFLDKVEALIREWSPEIIISNNAGDGHSDHNAVAFMIGSILRKTGLHKKITFYQGHPGSAHPMQAYCPTVFWELSEEHIKVWQKALDCFPSQFPGHELDNYAGKFAGAYGKICGVKYAQPFTESIFLNLMDKYKNTGKFVKAELANRKFKVIRL